MKEETSKKKHRAPEWWGRPKKFSERQHERKIGWLELFYDLVYVAAISQLTHALTVHTTWWTLGLSILFFSFIMWSWVNGSQYYDLHGSDGIRTSLITFWQMLSVAAVAITINDAYEGNHHPMAAALIVLQLMITYIWWSVGLYDPGHRKFNIYYTTSYLAACLLLVISLFTSFDIALLLWIGAVLFNFSPPITAAGTIKKDLQERGETFSASAAIVERFGLFTIIVLAESIMAVVTGVAEVKDKDPNIWIAFMIAVLIAFLIWSIYFDMTSEQETKKGYNNMQWLIFLHFPLLGSLSVIGAGIKVLITDTVPENIYTAEIMFCLALAVMLLMVVGITKIMEEDAESRSYIKPVARLLIISSILITGIPLLGALSSTTFLTIIALLLFVPVFSGIRHWVQFRFYGKE